MGRRRRPPVPTDPREAADAILADEEILWFPIRHYSPACALHLTRLIEAVRPAAVLVEGPDDATEQIPWIVHPDTEPPLTILSSYVDRKNKFGMNGVLSSSPVTPARYRGWWPLVAYAPEYAALKAGHGVGAELIFIDAPLPATIPYTHAAASRRTQVVDDRHLAENRWFDALAGRGGHRSFDAFWEGTFEAGGTGVSTETFRRSVLVFAWCARHVPGPPRQTEAEETALALDGTLLREAHMRWHVDRARKAHDGPIVVVTGAFHTVALPWTRGKRAPGRADANTTTTLTAHSFPALAKLYGMNRMPAYGQAVGEAIAAGASAPLDEAARRLVVEVVRSARSDGLAVSTADGIAALQHASGLAALRGSVQVTRDDLLDALQATLVKGALEHAGGVVEAAARKVLVGARYGRLAPEAGQVPLARDFYEAARRHRIDVTGAAKTVRLDLHRKEAHRMKSAFLHRCAFLEVPLFGTLDTRGWQEATFFRGPDPVEGTDMHLLGETWAVQWGEEVDDRLLELSDQGPTLGAVATAVLADSLPTAKQDVSAATRLLLQSTRMWLLELVDEALGTVGEALARDGAFGNLVQANADLVLLHGYRDILPTAGDPRVARLVHDAHSRACLAIPSLGATAPDHVAEVLDHLQTLVRFTLTFDEIPLDRRLLVERVRDLVADGEAEPTVRGAGYGILHGFGTVREAAVSRALEGYLASTPEHARGAGAFLDGLFLTSRSVFLRSRRLLQAVDRVLSALDWETFKRVLPDLRRAFTRFVPAELDAIGARVGRELGVGAPEPEPEALTEAGRDWAVAMDQRVGEHLEGWLRSAD